MMVGHIEKFALSSTAIATSLCVVSGFSVIFEMSCALKILGGQIYGARQYRRFCVLVYTYCYCSFESSLYPLILQEVGKFAVCLISALFAYATLHTSSHSLLFDAKFDLSSCYEFLCHFLFSHSFLNSIFYWHFILCERTRAPISMELFHGLGKFLCYAVPSARMICFEWWSFELLTLLSELLPNPELKVSVLSI
ncbi:hypothetical protein AHAS_Ahas19G0257500 [Arachis hypogaea]